MSAANKTKTVQELNDFFSGKEVMIIGEHEYTGTITKFVCMVNADGTQPNLNDKPTKDLRMCVTTPFHKKLHLAPKNIFVIANKQKHQSIWN